MKKYLRNYCFTKTTGKSEWIALVLWLILVCIVQYFHEPWFDEAQAWMIARSASIQEILFDIPHYEGHPQLWHLILVPFAKLGFPFHITISTINITICAVAMWLLLFVSPFPKIVRCIIPFTYFPFYQYGVISRPYCIMMLAMCLMAITYINRNQKPIRYILSLVLQSLSGAFGLIIAGGLCIVWTLEIVTEYRIQKKWGKLIKDARFWSLVGILIVALCIAVSLVPAEDVYYIGYAKSYLNRLKDFSNILMIPSDCLFGNYLTMDTESQTLTGAIFDCIGGICIFIILITLTKENKKLLTFLIPFFLFQLFAVIKYFSLHHLGIATFYIIFIFWIMMKEPDGLQIPAYYRSLWDKINFPMVKNIAKAFVVLLCGAPVFYSVASTVLDFKTEYGPTNMTKFIKENQIENRKILLSWPVLPLDKMEQNREIEDFIFNETLPVVYPDTNEMQFTYLMGEATANLVYFDHNIFMNYNADNPDRLYVHHSQDQTKNSELFKLWHDKGLPDFIFGTMDLHKIYSEEELKDVTYYWIDTIEFGNIWKFYKSKNSIHIYIRSDLLDEYPQFEIKRYATILSDSQDTVK